VGVTLSLDLLHVAVPNFSPVRSSEVEWLSDGGEVDVLRCGGLLPGSQVQSTSLAAGTQEWGR